MTATNKSERYCTISDSIKQSCMEVKLMREGKMKKPTLNSLFTDIKKWKKLED